MSLSSLLFGNMTSASSVNDVYFSVSELEAEMYDILLGMALEVCWYTVDLKKSG